MTAVEQEIETLCELRKENEYLRKQNASMTLMTHEVFAEVIEHLRVVKKMPTPKRKPRCSKCGQEGHNCITCPEREEEVAEELAGVIETLRRSQRLRGLSPA